MTGSGDVGLADQDFEGTLAHEITERERLEQERQAAKARMQHSQKLESLGVLAGAVAHDFNNYLTGILGNAGMVLRKLPEDSPCRPLVEEIEKAVQHAAALSSQMLAYAARAAPGSQPLDLRSLIEEMAPILRISVSKKAALRLEPADALPAVEGDPSQIRQVLMNLITNASEALGSESGYISLEVSLLDAESADLEGADAAGDLPPGPYVVLEVSDTGCGMDDAARAEIYDPTFTTKGPGRGLGMTVVQGIVRDHGGAIKLDSAPGRGTTVKVLLAAAEPIAAGERRELRGGDPQDGRGTVLVVDDEEIIREIARRILEDRGYDVLIAEDGRRAVEVFARHAGEIDAVLLDLTMPELDGAETFLELRRLRKDLRVILTSGFDPNDAMIRSIVTDQTVDFLRKPYRPAELIEKVRAVTRT